MNIYLTKFGMMAVAGLLAFLSLAYGEESDGRTSSVKLTHKMAKDAVGPSDLNAMISEIGIDYPLLLERALSKKPAAIFLLLWIAGNAPLDGAGTDGYTYTMVRAAKEIGDEALSVEAKKLDRTSQQAVAEAFLYEYGESDNPETAVTEISKAFPKLWGIIRKNQEGKQEDAGKSVSHPESKSKGGDKPQPESDGRSR